MHYALLFKEGAGAGYLLVNDIMLSLDAAMQTVLSRSNPELYIRKYLGNVRQYQVDGESGEVRFSTPRLKAPYFTELRDWHDYGITHDSHGRMVSSFSMIFKRYAVDMTGIHYELKGAGRRKTEAFLWHFIKLISLAVAYLQCGYTREHSIDPN